jgi:hypothetical protein
VMSIAYPHPEENTFKYHDACPNPAIRCQLWGPSPCSIQRCEYSGMTEITMMARYGNSCRKGVFGLSALSFFFFRRVLRKEV